jgi:hypothetical protein
MLSVFFDLFLLISISRTNPTLEKRKGFEDRRIQCLDLFPEVDEFPPGHDVAQYGGSLTKLCAWEQSRNSIGCICIAKDSLLTCEESKADATLFYYEMQGYGRSHRDYCTDFCWCKDSEPQFVVTRERSIGNDGLAGLRSIPLAQFASLSANSCRGRQDCSSRSHCRHKKHTAFYDPGLGRLEYRSVCIPTTIGSGNPR